MINLFKHFIYIFIASHLVACDIITSEMEDSTNDIIEYRLDILPSNEIEFQSEISSKIITIHSSHRWEINDIPEWINVKPTAGIDTTQVTISVTKNESSEERHEKILIQSEVEENWIYIYQSGIREFDENSDEIKMIFSSEYIEGSYSFLCNDGQHVIVTPQTSIGPTFYVGELDMNDGSILNDESIMIQCDSEMRPIHIYCNSDNYFIQYKEDTFDLYIIDDSDNEETYSNIKCNNKLLVTKASTEGLTNLDKAGMCLDIVGIALEYKNAGKAAACKELEKLITLQVAAWEFDPITQNIFELGLNIAEIYLENSRLGIAGAVISSGQLLKECALFMTKRYIGDLSPTINSAVQTSINGARVDYTITSSQTNTRDNPMISIYSRQKSTTLWKQGDIKDAKIGNDFGQVENLISGPNEFRVIVYPSIFIDNIALQEYYGYKSKVISVDIISPTCNINKVDEVKYNSAQITCNFTHIPQNAECYLCLLWEDGYQDILLNKQEGEQIVTVSDLLPNTCYECYNYIKCSDGEIYGERVQFTTEHEKASIQATTLRSAVRYQKDKVLFDIDVSLTGISESSQSSYYLKINYPDDYIGEKYYIPIDGTLNEINLPISYITDLSMFSFNKETFTFYDNVTIYLVRNGEVLDSKTIKVEYNIGQLGGKIEFTRFIEIDYGHFEFMVSASHSDSPWVSAVEYEIRYKCLECGYGSKLIEIYNGCEDDYRNLLFLWSSPCNHRSFEFTSHISITLINGDTLETTKNINTDL